MNKIKNSEISIILPTLNEGKNPEFLIPDIFKFLSSKIERFEIIIVDDGSQIIPTKFVVTSLIENTI